MKHWLSVLLLGGIVGGLLADGPQDNIPDKVRRIPPPGIKLSAEDRRELAAGVKELGQAIKQLRTSLQKKPALLELLPDVQIYYNAVHAALTYDEFFKPAEVQTARKLLEQGKERARLLSQGQAPWTTATGLVVRGYVSYIDGSVQPYGLVVPASYRQQTPHKHRLDIWFHGREENLSEVNFLIQRQASPGRFTPPDTIVLHPYGRYCNANHFAGEVDTFEAVESVRRRYPIDTERIVVRGFSMGGAACWHFAVHHAGLWAAAAPGAGFSETPDFLKDFQSEKLEPTWYEKKLWHWYDCTDWALNLYQCPVVAYSGEKDRQKQAADIMASAMAKEGLTLQHIIGPGTEHTYHPLAQKEIDRRINAIVASGRRRVPPRVRFTTWTLRYNRMLWLMVDGLKEHWEQARVEADIVNATTIKVTTKNVTAFTLRMGPGDCPLDPTTRPVVVLDGKELTAAPVLSDRSWKSSFHWTKEGWATGPPDDGSLTKRHGLQGPIDDAYLSGFVMVRPTSQALNPKVEKWAAGELKHALEHWRQQFRGQAPVKDDAEISDADIKNRNLILWGDPSSNKVLAKISSKLPIAWDAKEVRLGPKTYAADHHVPVLIYPNPLNPKRYIVLNSGFTFREYDYLNNARQVPKLPDFAILDVDQPPTSQRPAGIFTAGFFDERWQLPREEK
jgi:dienelactone hydrolase